MKNLWDWMRGRGKEGKSPRSAPAACGLGWRQIGRGLPSIFLLFLSSLLSAPILAQENNPGISDNNQQRKSPAMTSAATIPNSPDELWERILILLNTNHSFFSREDVERVIGIRFTVNNVDGLPENTDFRTQAQEVAGLGTVRFFMDTHPKKIRFIAMWGSPVGGKPPSEACLSRDKATADLTAQGWESVWGGVGPEVPSISFSRTADMEAARKGIRPYDSISEVSLSLWPDRYVGQCAISFSARIFRP